MDSAELINLKAFLHHLEVVEVAPGVKSYSKLNLFAQSQTSLSTFEYLRNVDKDQEIGHFVKKRKVCEQLYQSISMQNIILSTFYVDFSWFDLP